MIYRRSVKVHSVRCRPHHLHHPDETRYTVFSAAGRKRSPRAGSGHGSELKHGTAGFYCRHVCRNVNVLVSPGGHRVLLPHRHSLPSLHVWQLSNKCAAEEEDGEETDGGRDPQREKSRKPNSSRPERMWRLHSCQNKVKWVEILVLTERRNASKVQDKIGLTLGGG